MTLHSTYKCTSYRKCLTKGNLFKFKFHGYIIWTNKFSQLEFTYFVFWFWSYMYHFIQHFKKPIYGDFPFINRRNHHLSAWRNPKRINLTLIMVQLGIQSQELGNNLFYTLGPMSLITNPDYDTCTYWNIGDNRCFLYWTTDEIYNLQLTFINSGGFF